MFAYNSNATHIEEVVMLFLCLSDIYLFVLFLFFPLILIFLFIAFLFLFLLAFRYVVITFEMLYSIRSVYISIRNVIIAFDK